MPGVLCPTGDGRVHPVLAYNSSVSRLVHATATVDAVRRGAPLLWIRAGRAWPAGPTTEASMGRKRGPDYRACGLALALDDRRHAGSAMSTVGGSVSE